MSFNYDFIEIPKEVRDWINCLPGYYGINIQKNTFTNQERWLMGQTDAQIWNYVKLDPFWNCPMRDKCPAKDKRHCLDEKKRDLTECWEFFKKWAKTPIGEENTENSSKNE